MRYGCRVLYVGSTCFGEESENKSFFVSIRPNQANLICVGRPSSTSAQGCKRKTVSNDCSWVILDSTFPLWIRVVLKEMFVLTLCDSQNGVVLRSSPSAGGRLNSI